MAKPEMASAVAICDLRDWLDNVEALGRWAISGADWDLESGVDGNYPGRLSSPPASCSMRSGYDPNRRVLANILQAWSAPR
jgi:hypothetical protein